MKTNKGFSLVELLAAMAIFMIAMVSVVAMMRSSAISYRNEVVEVDTQVDSQMLLAQIEEYLIDCNYNVSLVAPTDSDYVSDCTTYRIINVPDGASLPALADAIADNTGSICTKTYIIYEPYKNDVGTKQEGKIYINNKSQLLASGVQEFEITGLDFPKSATGDNKCKVSGKVKKKTQRDYDTSECGVDVAKEGKGYEYASSKQVYFRNHIENEKPFVLTGSGGGIGGSADDRNIQIKRYELVDITTLGIGVDYEDAYENNKADLGLKITQDVHKYDFWYIKKDTTDDSIPNKVDNPGNWILLSTPFTLTSAQLKDLRDGKTDIYIATSDQDDYDSEVTLTHNCVVEKGSKKVHLVTEKVSYDTGSGIIAMPNKKLENGGSCDILCIKGLDLAAALKYWGVEARKYTCIIYRDEDGNKQCGSGEQDKWVQVQGITGSHNSGAGDAKDAKIDLITFDEGKIKYSSGSNVDMTEGKLQFYLGCMAETTNLCLTMRNESGGDLSGYADNFSDGKTRICFTIELPDGSTKTVDYMLIASNITMPSGSDFGNVY